MSAAHPTPSAQDRDPVPSLRVVGSPTHDSIDAWLTLLERFLRMSPRETAGIREELENHLRDRVDDLLLTGSSIEQAESTAIAELGDAAVLASRYRHARSFHTRRLVMHLSLLTLAGAAVTVGVVAVTQPSAPRASVFTPPPPSETEQELLKRQFRANFKNASVADVLGYTIQSSGMPTTIVWKSLEESGVDREQRVNITDDAATVTSVLHALSEQIAPGPEEALDFRVVGNDLKIATTSYFDRREMILATYDLSAISVEPDAVISLVQTFVHSPGWEANGGTLARVQAVNHRLFVEAPKRYHEKIEWFVHELAADSKTNTEAPDLAIVQREEARRKAIDHEQQQKMDADKQSAIEAARRREQAMLAVQDQSQLIRDQLQQIRQEREKVLALARQKQDEIRDIEKAHGDTVIPQQELSMAFDHAKGLQQRELDLQNKALDLQLEAAKLVRQQESQAAAQVETTQPVHLNRMNAASALNKATMVIDQGKLQHVSIAVDARTNALMVSGEPGAVKRVVDEVSAWDASAK